MEGGDVALFARPKRRKTEAKPAKVTESKDAKQAEDNPRFTREVGASGDPFAEDASFESLGVSDWLIRVLR